MSSVPFAQSELASLKKALRTEYPHVSSSHLSEAIAAALGFRTHASLLAALPATSDDPDFVLLDDDAFEARLIDFGHPPDPEFTFEYLQVPWLRTTYAPRAWEIEYKSARDKAWRNLIVETVNEGLRRKLFSLNPNDNRWDGWTERHAENSARSVTFDFQLSNGRPAIGYVADAGFAELAVNVAVIPTLRGQMWVSQFNAGFRAGDAFAASWLERERGAWIQSSTTSFACRRPLLLELASLNVRPMGFGDRGRVIM